MICCHLQSTQLGSSSNRQRCIIDEKPNTSSCAVLTLLQTVHFDQRLSCTFFLHPDEEFKGAANRCAGNAPGKTP
jgi:hypothetical protein